jgi:hypothetical protein
MITRLGGSLNWGPLEIYMRMRYPPPPQVGDGLYRTSPLGTLAFPAEQQTKATPLPLNLRLFPCTLPLQSLRGETVDNLRPGCAPCSHEQHGVRLSAAFELLPKAR